MSLSFSCEAPLLLESVTWVDDVEEEEVFVVVLVPFSFVLAEPSKYECSDFFFAAGLLSCVVALLFAPADVVDFEAGTVDDDLELAEEKNDEIDLCFLCG